MNQPRNQDRDDAGIAVLIVEDAPASLTAHLPHPTPHTPAAAPTRRGRWRSRLAWLGVIVLVFAALTVLFLLGELPRRHQAVALAAAVEQNAHRLIQVRVVTPKPAPAATTLNLPGNIEAARSTGIFAQAGGLVSERSVEIGDHVTAGQVLARIDTSEVARELARAEATLTLANASVELATVQFNRARTDYERTVPLGPALVGQQVLDHLLADRDTSAANLDVAKGQVAVDAAEVARLRLLVGYGEVTAPFAGIITARNVEVGNLIPAGGSITPLFALAQAEPLRAVVEVPQAAVPGVEPDMAATVTGAPGSTVEGTVARAASAIDTTTRTMRVEIGFPAASEAARRLTPGQRVQVSLSIPRHRPLLVIPADAILFSGAGTQVAKVDDANRVHLAAVKIVSDSGTEVQIADGLAKGDRVIANPGSTIDEGVEVEVITTASATMPASTTVPASAAVTPAATAATPSGQSGGSSDRLDGGAAKL